MNGYPKQMEPPVIQKVHNYVVVCPILHTYYGSELLYTFDCPCCQVLNRLGGN